MKKIVFALIVIGLFSCEENRTKNESSPINEIKKELPIEKKGLNCKKIKEFCNKGNLNHFDTIVDVNWFFQGINSPIYDTIKMVCNSCRISGSNLNGMNQLSVDFFNNVDQNSWIYYAGLDLDYNCKILRLILKENNPHSLKYFYVINDSIEKRYIAGDRVYKDGMKMADGYSMADYLLEKKKYLKNEWSDPEKSLEVWY